MLETSEERQLITYYNLLMGDTFNDSKKLSASADTLAQPASRPFILRSFSEGGLFADAELAQKTLIAFLVGDPQIV